VFNIPETIHRLNKDVIRKIEIEFDVLKERFPELEFELNQTFNRLRAGVFDSIGSVEREVKSNCPCKESYGN
jgi:hypothetical protein